MSHDARIKPFRSSAQNFEDVVLWRVLEDVERGCYVDVGAYDPVIDSISWPFYEQGWRGALVEPVPSLAAELRRAGPTTSRSRLQRARRTERHGCSSPSRSGTRPSHATSPTGSPK